MKLKKFYYKKIKSTNDKALKYIKNGIEKGIIITNIQTKGKGQRGKNWISLRGNLFMSVFFEIIKYLSLKKITYINTSIIEKIIKKKTNSNISVKLPNDILINNKKVCGILQETVFKNNIKYLIVGIGINLINSPNLIKYSTTYLNNYSKKKINKIKLFNEIKLNYEKKIKYFRI